MESMDLEQYRTRLRRNAVLGGVVFFGFIALFTALQLSISAFSPADSAALDFLAGYRLGFFLGLELCLIVYEISVIVALRSEKRLKRMWIQQNDERKQAIASKASQSTWLASIICLGCGLIVSSFYSLTVFLTLLGVFVVMMVCFFASLIFYQFKY